jgi:hypothetical protein
VALVEPDNLETIQPQVVVALDLTTALVGRVEQIQDQAHNPLRLVAAGLGQMAVEGILAVQ